MRSLNTTRLKGRLREEALALGFDLAGVTTAEPFERYSAYESWLGEGMHAGMAYLASERGRSLRRTPADVLPGARSVLVLAARYPGAPDWPARVGEESRGSVAAYARNPDYHDALQEKAAALMAFIAAECGDGLTARAYTDTGAVLEREFGTRAGLGWQGKNTCLIHPVLGSYFFLTEIFLSLELEADEPFPDDRCGTCRRCLDACPTGCLLPGRVLDARRCLAYLTIENKGAIPVDLRPALGERVFGCDICQQVCPWNRKTPVETNDLDLHALFSLNPRDFKRRFAGSPLQRAGRRGLLRNAAVVLGNRGGEREAVLLAQVLTGEAEPLVRAHTAWALGQIGARLGVRTGAGQARRSLDRALKAARLGGEEEVVPEIIQALEEMHVP